MRAWLLALGFLVSTGPAEAAHRVRYLSTSTAVHGKPKIAAWRRIGTALVEGLRRVTGSAKAPTSAQPIRKRVRLSSAKREPRVRFTSVAEVEPVPAHLPAGARWIQQTTDIVDCAPALALNAAAMLGLALPHRTVADVRRAAPSEGPRWSANDLTSYLVRHTDLEWDGKTLAFPEGDVLAQIERQGPFRMIHMTSHGHFTGFIHGARAGEYVMLDSMTDGPSTIDRATLEKRLASNRPLEDDLHVLR
jgi:hypothetical protein